MISTQIIIMAKVPVAGISKIRLIPELGIKKTEQLAKMLFQHTIDEAIAENIGPVKLCVTPCIDHESWQQFNIPEHVLWQQHDGDLGERLTTISYQVTQQQLPYLIIGTDCPTLDRNVLLSAAQALQYSDTCIIPVSDGGYALLGLHQHHDSNFDRIPWSTTQVCALTEQRITALKWSISKLQKLHKDILC